MIILSEEVCPWKINFNKTQTFYYDRREYNIWNEEGNGWKEDDASLSIKCYNRTSVRNRKRRN